MKTHTRIFSVSDLGQIQIERDSIAHWGLLRCLVLTTGCSAQKVAKHCRLSIEGFRLIVEDGSRTLFEFIRRSNPFLHVSLEKSACG